MCPPAEPDHELIAIARYESLLVSAPTDVIEKVHLEAFEKLTPGQLDTLFEKLSSDAEPGELDKNDASPPALARAATQIGQRHPAALRRILLDDGPFGAAFAAAIYGTLVGWETGAGNPYLWSRYGIPPDESEGFFPSSDAFDV